VDFCRFKIVLRIHTIAGDLMDTTVLVGYIAGTLTTISFVPQVARAWKLKETRDISLAMLLLFAAGILLWTMYGVWTGSMPIIAANVMTFILILLLLGMKMRYK
jgi:MtN3 and saliva related transmembrane protein